MSAGVNDRNVIGILGGTFDPVHCGHLRLALEIRDALGLSKVLLVPAANPRLRQTPIASVECRVRMIDAAIVGISGLDSNHLEIFRKGETRTIETLQILRDQNAGQSLCLILGMDTFLRLHQWHRYQDLLTLAHIAIALRPHSQLPEYGPLATLLSTHRTDNRADLQRSDHGLIVVTDTPTLEISATRIRTMSAQGRCIRFLVPDAVHTILEQEAPYTNGQ